MTPRSIRRAAERKAKKLALKETRLQALAARKDEAAVFQRAEDVNNSSAERKARKLAIKESRLEANRANAELSTGPRTPEGKAISSLNALKTGLTGRTVVLPSDDAAAYQQHVAAYEAEYKPVGLRECELVQSLADSRWRLNRIPKLEAAIYAQGRAEFAAGSDDDDKDEAAVSQRAEDSNNVHLQTYLQYEKQLKNLHLQEARLNRALVTANNTQNAVAKHRVRIMEAGLPYEDRTCRLFRNRIGLISAKPYTK